MEVRGIIDLVLKAYGERIRDRFLERKNEIMQDFKPTFFKNYLRWKNLTNNNEL